MNYPLIVFVVTLVLLVLYLLARLFRPFGQGLAFVCTVLGRVNVKFVEQMSKAAAYCIKVRLASLNFPPGIGEGDYWSGVNVLARLVYFVLAVLILSGETVNTFLVLPSLFHTANQIHLPGMIEFASAALFLCTPALFGAVLLECCGLIPNAAGLFPRMGKLFRWVLGVLSGLFFTLAILLTGYFYLFRAMYLLDPQSAQGMSLYILGGLGLLIAAVSVLALWALVVGSAGVVSLLLWIVELVCRILAGAASFLPSILDVVAVHLSGGTMSVHGDFVGHDPYKVPALPFSSSRRILPGQTVAAMLPQHASAIVDADTEDIVPIQTTITEVSMKNPDKNASIVFVGSFGSHMFSPVAQKIADLRATESILTSAYLDLSITHVQATIPSIVDLSPTHAERKEALLHSETEGDAYHTLLNRLADTLVDTHLETKAAPAPLIFVLDCHVLCEAIEMLASIKRRLPIHSLVVVTSLSAVDVQNKAVQTGIADMQSLHAEGIVETVIVTDPRYSFALAYGEETQRQFLAQTLVSLVIAHKHSHNNRSFTNVLHELHTLSPFTAISFASEAVAIGVMPKRWAWLPGVAGKAGTGYYGDILTQAKAAIDKVVTQEKTRTFPSQVSSNAPCLVVVNVPIRLDDKRFAACLRDNALYISSHYPHASSLTVRGNGCAYPHTLGSRFLVQAACLYPFTPSSLLPKDVDKQVSVTPSSPSPLALTEARSNMESIGQEQTAIATTPQKRPAVVSRRAGRKNAKAEN